LEELRIVFQERLTPSQPMDIDVASALLAIGVSAHKKRAYSAIVEWSASDVRQVSELNSNVAPAAEL
jgi:hypothetical protein